MKFSVVLFLLSQVTLCKASLQDPVDVSDGGQVVSLNARELKKKKAGKAAKKGSGGNSYPIESLEGVYLYRGCDNNIFQASISCGIFGDSDPDLCLYQEVKLGQVSETAASQDSALTSDGNYFNPDSILENLTVDPSHYCIFSGTFRASAAIEGNNVLPIPLATSNGCSNVSANFLYTVKLEVKDDGNLNLDFSNDGGSTYYTQEGEQCDASYVGNKFQDMNEMVAMSADRGFCSDERRILKHGRRLCPPCVVVVVAPAAPAAAAATTTAAVAAGAAVVSSVVSVATFACIFFCSF